MRFHYPTFMFDDPAFEIDENGDPWWVCPRVSHTIGLFGGRDIVGAVLVNAVTGESAYYEAGSVPNWVDHVFTAELIMQQYDYHGTYVNGFINSLFGQRDVTVTTEGYNYIAIGDDVYMYTGVTSVVSDQSNIGFILSNQRTKETKYYPCAGATEYSAMDSAEGQVQQMKYTATFPLLLNISDQPTYFMALKGEDGLVKMYAMVNVQQYNIVETGQTVAQCEDCREVLKCPKCSVPMVYHKSAHKVLCHYCGSQQEPPPTLCPACGGKLQYRGFGTQKAEEELAKLFPEARVLRMDQDSTAAKDAHEKLLAKFAAHEYDIMVGTQMVAKGLDFEDVTLVGVLGIDSLLFAQGFRAYENVFSLITQVVGRSGRAKEPGFAIIQTTDPDNPVLTLAAAQDYDAFYEQEIAYRKLGLYPPFCGLCVIGFAGAKENEVARAAARFSALLGQQAAKQPDLPLRILGPTPGSIEKINDTYRYKLTVKCRNDRRFRDLVRSTLALYEKEKLPSKASVVVDLHSDGDI